VFSDEDKSYPISKTFSEDMEVAKVNRKELGKPEKSMKSDSYQAPGSHYTSN